VLKNFFVHLLTPVGALGFFFALREIWRKAPEDAPCRLLAVWILASIFYALIFWCFLIYHSYYLVPVASCMAVAVGFGLDRGWEWLKGRRLKFFWTTMAAIFFSASLAVIGHLYPGLYSIADWGKKIVLAGQAVDQKTPKHSYVVASYDTGPIQLYYCHRKGWIFDMISPKNDEELIRSFEALRKDGANYFVTSTLDLLHTRAEFEKYLRSRYAVVEENPDFIILNLTKSPTNDVLSV
jgi:hypothetical protein